MKSAVVNVVVCPFCDSVTFQLVIKLLVEDEEIKDVSDVIMEKTFGQKVPERREKDGVVQKLHYSPSTVLS